MIRTHGNLHAQTLLVEFPGEKETSSPGDLFNLYNIIVGKRHVQTQTIRKGRLLVAGVSLQITDKDSCSFSAQGVSMTPAATPCL